MRIISTLAILLLLPFMVSAGNLHSSIDPNEVRFIQSPRVVDQKYQQILRQQDAWKQFSTVNPQWWVQFNESTGRPHRALGKPVSVPVTGTPQQAALYFLNNNASMFLPAGTDLRYAGSTTTEKYYQPNFVQYYLGMEILWSRATVKLNKQNEAVMFGMDVYSNIRLLEIPLISEQDAVTKATAGLLNITGVTVNPAMKILPVPGMKKNRFYRVYQINVKTLSEDGIPTDYYTLVDANTGKIHYRANNVKHFSANTDISAGGTVYPTNIYNPSAFRPLSYLKMDLGGIIYNADVNGNFPTVVLGAPTSATFTLEGHYAKVVTGAAGTGSPMLTSTINPGANSISFDNTTTIRHLSAYYHTNIVHDFMKSKLPTFTDMDDPMMVRVDHAGGTCNAFYNGELNFYSAGGGCNGLSQVGDVVYHEYGHGICWSYWADGGLNFDNDAMGEGYADVWAISITADPVLGIGYDSNDPTVFIRNYDFNNGVKRKVYPQNIVGESHADGEIIAGAWYSTALKLGSLSTMTDLYAESLGGLANGPNGTEGQVYLDILIDALYADDTDADLTNGTPNGIAITDAFAQHGITLLSAATLTHTPVTTTSAYTGIVIDAQLNASTFFWAFSQMRGAYQVNGSGPWIPFTMTNTTGNNYSFTIPGYPPGTIIGYYLGLQDTYNQYGNVLPPGADVATNPNIPYYVMVGYNLLFTDDFDFNAGFWISGIAGDDAVTGLWEMNEPIATVQGNITVQPNYQVTPGGLFCYITQADPGTQLGSYDVDSGKTTCQSPDIDMSQMNNPAIAYYRWYSNDQGNAPGLDFWQVYISNDGVNYVPVEHTPTADHSWRRFAFRVADYVQPTATVSVRFVAEDANEGSLIEALMDDFSVYETVASGLNENPDILTAAIAPNPANDLINLQFALARSGNFNLSVTDMIGQEVYRSSDNYTSGMNRITIPVNQLAAGIYQLNLSGDKGIKCLKFVVTH